MKKRYRLNIYDPKDQKKRYDGVIMEADSVVMLRDLIAVQGYEIDGEPVEIHVSMTFLDKINEWYNAKFASSVGFSLESELQILSAYASALGRGSTQKGAFEQAKADFGKSDKKIRNQIDILIKTCSAKNLLDSVDVFIKNEEMFSEGFLSLVQQTRGTNISMEKIISNPVSDKDKGEKLEGYVELTKSINELTTSLKKKITTPLFRFFGMMSLILGILLGIIPNYQKGFAKVADISDYSFYGIGEFTLATSHFFTNYGLYFLVVLIISVLTISFFYNNNLLFKEAVQKYFLNMYIVGDIISLYYTKKVVSLMALLYEFGMQPHKVYEKLIALTTYIPIRKELEFIGSKIKSNTYSQIFAMYPESDRSFTETFYLQLEKQSNNKGGEITGRFNLAFASILVNTERIWNRSISKYPDRIGKMIMTIAFVLVGVYTTGVLLIITLTALKSV